VLVAGTFYEALVALGAIDLGELPGEGPPGEDWVLRVALLSMFAASAVVIFARRAPYAALLAPAAAAFMVTRFYTFDPYYLPTLLRYSTQGMFRPAFVFGVAAAAGGAALLTRARPSIGSALSVPVVLACAFTSWFLGVGH
jgi:hypothetical protein